MKIVVVSDFHADMYNQYANPVKGKVWNDRFQNQLDTLDKIYDIAIKNNAIVIFNGDLFNQRVNINQVVYTQIVDKIVDKSMRLITQTGHKTMLLSGNHDQYDNSRIPPNSLQIFNRFPQCTVINKPLLLRGKGEDLVFLPYSEDTDWLKNELNKIIDKEKCDNSYLFAHVGVSGAVQGKWNHRLGGAFNLSELHPEYFKQIILGHYHLRQSLTTSTDCKAYYVGNTIPLNHNDDDQDKGIYLVDTINNSTKFIPIDNPKFITVDSEKISAEKLKKLAKNNYIKIVVHSKDEILNYQDVNNSLISYQPDASTSESDLGITPTDSTKQIVEQYTDKYYPNRSKIALDVLNETIESRDHN